MQKSNQLYSNDNINPSTHLLATFSLWDQAARRQQGEEQEQ